MDLLDNLLNTTYTNTAAHRRLGLLRHGLEVVLYQDEQESVTAGWQAYTATIDNPADRTTLQALGTDWLASVTTSNVASTLEQLQTELALLPVFRLTVPCTLDEDAAATISDWCRTNLQPKVLLALTVDPDTVGGCAFVWNDVYHEYTLSTRLRAAPRTIPELLQTYV